MGSDLPVHSFNGSFLHSFPQFTFLVTFTRFSPLSRLSQNGQSRSRRISPTPAESAGGLPPINTSIPSRINTSNHHESPAELEHQSQTSCPCTVGNIACDSKLAPLTGQD